MSLNFKYIPLTFLKDVNQIKEQIKNTILLRYLFDKFNDFSKLEELIIGTQYGYNASALQSGENKFLRISDITDGKVNWDSVPFCDCSDEKTYLLEKNDLLIARTGGTTGKSFLIDNPPEKAIFAGYLIRIRANKENNPDFLNIFLNSYVYWSQVISLNKGEFRPSVNATKLKDLIIPKVDIEIQKEAINISKGISIEGYEGLENDITKALNDFNKSQEIIEQCKIQKDNNELLKQSILQEAIQGKLTTDWRKQNPNTEPASELLKRIKAEKVQLIKDKKIKKEKALPAITKEEIPFELPEDWVWTILDEVSLFKNGKAHEQFVDANGKYILINSKYVSTNGKVAKYTGKQMMPMYIKEIAIVMSDVPNGRALSRCFMIDADDKYSLNQRIGGIVALTGLYHDYLIKILDRNRYYLSFNDGKKQTNLKKSQIMSCPIPLPPLEEQKAIVEKVEFLMQKCQALEEEIKTSEANSQMLMQAVLKEAFESKKEEVCQD
jgi:type I restriction enzyme, S subunit